MPRAIGTLNRAQFLRRSLQIDECVKEAIYGVRAYTESGGYSGYFFILLFNENIWKWSVQEVGGGEETLERCQWDGKMMVVEERLIMREYK